MHQGSVLVLPCEAQAAVQEDFGKEGQWFGDLDDRVCVQSFISRLEELHATSCCYVYWNPILLLNNTSNQSLCAQSIRLNAHGTSSTCGTQLDCYSQPAFEPLCAVAQGFPEMA